MKFRANPTQLLHPAGVSIATAAEPSSEIGFTTVNGLFGKCDGWQDDAALWGNSNTKADWSSCYYWEGVFGWDHTKHREKLANLLELERSQRPLPGQQHAIGHSNGCRLLLEALEAHDDLRINDVHLIAPWVNRDCDKNNINKLLARGQVDRIFLYVSSNDDVLGFNALSPFYWGWTLGKDGPTNAAFRNVTLGTLGPSNIAGARLIQVNDDAQTHCSWVNDLATIQIIAAISAPAVVPA